MNTIQYVLNIIEKQFDMFRTHKEIICLDKNNIFWKMFDYEQECKWLYDFLVRYLLDGDNSVSLKNIPNNFLIRVSEAYNYLQDEKSQKIFTWLLNRYIGALFTENMEVIDKLYPPIINSNIDNTIFISDTNKYKLFVDGYTIISDYKEVMQTWILKSYELLPYFKIEHDDIIIDGGAYKGETAIWFASQTGNNGKIYAFEIHPDNVKIIKDNIAYNDMNKKIKIVDKGLWNENINAFMVTSGMKDTAYFCNEKQRFGNEDNISTITIDSFIECEKLNKIDMIKMDIEGAEEKAILGAFKTLQTHKPKLAIAIYHKFFDFIDLLILVKKINPSYKLYLSYEIEPVLFAL